MAINIIMNRWCSPGRISSLLHQLIKLEIINIPKIPCWTILNMIPLPMHPAIASHRDKKGHGSRFGMRSEYSAVTKTSLFVAKITFVVAEIIFKVTVMAYLMVKFTSAVTEITFSGADTRLLVTKITFVAAEKLLKWLWSLLQSQDKFVVALIFFSVADTSLFAAKISFVMAEITFKEAVITSSLVKITVVVAAITFNAAVITPSVVKISFLVA